MKLLINKGYPENYDLLIPVLKVMGLNPIGVTNQKSLIYQYFTHLASLVAISVG